VFHRNPLREHHRPSKCFVPHCRDKPNRRYTIHDLREYLEHPAPRMLDFCRTRWYNPSCDSPARRDPTRRVPQMCSPLSTDHCVGALRGGRPSPSAISRAIRRRSPSPVNCKPPCDADQPRAELLAVGNWWNVRKALRTLPARGLRRPDVDAELKTRHGRQRWKLCQRDLKLPIESWSMPLTASRPASRPSMAISSIPSLPSVGNAAERRRFSSAPSNTFRFSCSPVQTFSVEASPGISVLLV